jgi:hypothetical protein
LFIFSGARREATKNNKPSCCVASNPGTEALPSVHQFIRHPVGMIKANTKGSAVDTMDVEIIEVDGVSR